MQDKNISKALGRIPSGVYILGFQNPDTGKPDALLISWVQQLSFEPAMISWAMGKDRKVKDYFQPGMKCTLSILGQDNKSTMISFAKNPGQAIEDGQSSGNIYLNDKGLPVLTEALTTIDITVSEVLEASSADHALVAATVDIAHLHESIDTSGPMVHLRASGFSY